MSDMLPALDFYALIDRSLTDPAATQELQRRYLTEAAVMVIDFTGMVHRTEASGIIYALARSRAALKAMQPAIDSAGGQVLKQVADTFFAVFPSPADALQAALDAQGRLRIFNDSHPDPIRAGIGLGAGECLLLPGQDIYGAEVSRAFVLGEDVAHGDEVLATADFLAALGTPPPGVGTFRAHHDRVHTTGFPFHEVRDYR